MNDKEKIQEQLIEEIIFLKKSIEGLEKLGSEYMKVDEKLRDSENRLRKVLEAIQEGIAFSDETGYFYVYNPAMEGLTGYSIEEANACSDFISLLYPDPIYRVGAFKGLMELLEKGKSREIETIITTKSGQLKNVHISSSLISYHGSNLFLSVYRDITERKKAEERLTKINECFLNFVADSNENIKRIVTLCGELMQATCALYNRLEGELLYSVGMWHQPLDYNPMDKPEGHICYDVIRQAQDEVFIVRNLPETTYAKTDPNVTKHDLKTYIGKVVKRGGSPVGSLCVVYQNDFNPTEDDKKVFGILASAIGVEEERLKAEEILKQTQTQLIQSAKMEAIGRMASGVAHEVKNPLGIILQGINYLEDKLPLTKKDILEVMQMIKNNIKRADNIVRALIDFSRLTELHIEAEDVNSILESSLSLIQHRVKLENIEIVKDLKEWLPPVLADRRKIEQVLINILLNAIQAMPGGGRLFVLSYLTRFGVLEKKMRISSNNFEPDEELVGIEIEDTGIGIPEENLKKIFDPFFTTRGPEGSGLGLAVSKGIIEMHKGFVEIKSEVGKGTKVIIGLKISKGERYEKE